MFVRHNQIKAVDKSSIEYLCRNWHNYLILISIGNSIADSYYKVVNLVKETRDGLINRHKELNSESIVLIALNETDPYSFAREYLKKYFD